MKITPLIVALSLLATPVLAQTIQGTNTNSSTSGTVNPGTAGDGAYYASSTNTVSDAGTSGAKFGALGVGVAAPSAGELVSGASFGLEGNRSASGIFGTTGMRYANVAGTLNDTTATGTLANNYDSVYGGNTLTATGAVTITNDYGSYFLASVCSTNVTCTANSALGADSAKINGPLSAASIALNSGTVFSIGSLLFGAGSNTILEAPASAQLQMGAADVAGAPVAQTLSVQSAAAVANTNGANTTLDLSAGTGTGTAGTLTINGAPHSTTGSSKNAYSALLTLNGDTLATVFKGTLSATLGASTAADVTCYAVSTGLFTYEPTGTTCTVSARRFKQDINYLSPAHMLDEVLGMKPVSFRFKKGVGQDDGAEVHYGLIAEDVAQVAPELVAYEKDGQTHGVKYGDGELQSHLIGAIKAEQDEINQLKKQTASLSSEFCLGNLCVGWK